MKTNLILFSILVAMLIGVYIDQEVYQAEESKKELVEKSLFRQAEFEEFVFPSGSITMQGSQWIQEKTAWVLDQGKVAQFIKLVHSIQIKQKLVEFKKEEFFRKEKIELKVKAGGEVFDLWVGDTAEATGRFYVYLPAKDELYICEDSSVYDVPYSSERDYALKKYIRLTSILKQGIHVFWQSNFLDALKLTEIQKVMIDSTRNRPIEIDLVGGKTYPQAPAPLDYKDLAATLATYFKGIRVVKVIDSGQNYLTDQRSVLEIEGNQKYKMRYYKGLNDSYGKYIRIEGIDLIFQIEMKEKNLFFLTGNDFWVKNFHYDQSLSNLTKLDFSLRKGEQEWTDFSVFDLEKFKVKTITEGASFSGVHINVLFNLLLNLVDFKEASYVESVTESQFPQGEYLQVKLLESEMMVWVEESIIKVLDKKHKLLYYFPEATGQIKTGFFNSTFTGKPN